MIDRAFASFLGEFLFLMVLPFIVWVISWWGFISGKLALGGDAFYYYWDSRFFLENISHGVYPLWNPGYSGGVPWNFFLRRIGEVNPFYWAITGLKLLGFSPLHAHLIFVVSYFFLALVGFWLLARLFLKDRLTSTGAYLLLLFSWGGQLFYCFDILMMVPLVWFFYFLFAFARENKKHQFLGACFSLSLMISTYIPFFTLTIVSSFLFFFFLFFMKESFDFFKATFNFIRTQRIFAALSLVFFLLACIPAVDFYLESRGGGFILPSRHLGSTDPSELAIGISLNKGLSGVDISRTVWDILANGYFDKVFSNQQHMTIGDFNIAYPFFIVMILAMINPVSRRTSLLLVSGVFLMLSVVTKGKLYPFLMDHVFFFHFMRMLQLFFWLSILPIAILLAMEQLRVFLRDHYGRKNIKVLVFVVAVHVLFFAGLLTQEGIVWSSYLAVGMSLVFFILAMMGVGGRSAVGIILWCSLIIQPVEVARYIIQNSDTYASSSIMDHLSRYERQFSLLKRVPAEPVKKDVKGQGLGQIDRSGYYENPWIYNMRQFMYQEKIRSFVADRLMLFDNTAPEDDSSNENLFAGLSRAWGSHQNSASLSLDGSEPEDFQSHPGPLKPQVVYEGDPVVKVLSVDANTLRLETNLDRPRFLLWANGYHPGWHVYIDGHEGRLLRADYAFKGAWVPSGDHTVVFRFGTPLRYVVAYIVLFAFFVVLVWVIVSGFREGFLVEKEVALGN